MQTHLELLVGCPKAVDDVRNIGQLRGDGHPQQRLAHERDACVPGQAGNCLSLAGGREREREGGVKGRERQGVRRVKGLTTRGA
jgi:hypothetical protein